LAVRLPRATGLASSLSGYVSLTGQRCLFRHRRRCGRFSRVLPRRCVLPVSNAPFVPPFGVFRLAELPSGRPPESFVPCWSAVTTICLLGNCDSRRAETALTLLHSTQSGFSSPLVAWFLFSRGRQRANAARGTGESCLFRRDSRHRFQRDRANQPGPIFPRSPGIICEMLVELSFRVAISFFQ